MHTTPAVEVKQRALKKYSHNEHKEKCCSDRKVRERSLGLFMVTFTPHLVLWVM